MKISEYLKKPYYIILGLNAHGFGRFIPDSIYIRCRFHERMGYKLNLKSPSTYNEKLQWLKLHDRNPLYTTLVDKYAVKQYVAKIIGPEYIIPTIGVWDSFDQIDFQQLPEQFVLKCTHDSGGLVICKNKKFFNKDEARKKIMDSLNNDYYLQGREWPYKHVPRRIIAEKYMEDEKTKELRDYKFFCFGGSVKALFVGTERQKPGEDVKFDFFTPQYEHLEIKQGHENAITIPEKPINFEKMKLLAEKISKNLLQARIDFYEVNGKVFFGEVTFFHHCGWTPFVPAEWDRVFGEWLDITSVK